MQSPYPAYGNHHTTNPNNHSHYPPANGLYPASVSSSSSALNLPSPLKDPYSSQAHLRGGLRTPSPTPSEAEELARSSPLDWSKLKNPRFWLRREWLWYYVAAALISILTALITIYHSQIVHWLQPAALWMQKIPAGWTIPIGILFIISFPPLFGHEIVAVLCGVVWGLWIGFAIVAAGTFLGEIGNFYAFKWCCRARGEKLEKTNMTYGVLARVVREGGFKIALIARLSAIPGHFTTAVFSSCGMGIFTFALAAVLSLPKQFVTVYLGVIIEGADVETTGQRIASYAVVAITFAITILAMWYIYRQMARAKPGYIYDRRKARQAKLPEASMSTTSFSQSSVSLAQPQPKSHPYPTQLHHSQVQIASTSEVALHAYSPTEPGHQQWDASGRAVGHAEDPRLHQPSPRTARMPTLRTESGGGYSVSGERYAPGPGRGPVPDAEAGGVSYPQSPRADGRLPVRQNSEGAERDAPLSNPYDDPRAHASYRGTPVGTPGVITAPAKTRIAQAQSRPQSPQYQQQYQQQYHQQRPSPSQPQPQPQPQQQPLAASVSPYDAAYDYNPSSYPTHPYATADPSQTRWSAVPRPQGAPGSPAPGSGASSPRRVLSPPPSYAI